MGARSALESFQRFVCMRDNDFAPTVLQKVDGCLDLWTHASWCEVSFSEVLLGFRYRQRVEILFLRGAEVQFGMFDGGQIQNSFHADGQR